MSVHSILQTTVNTLRSQPKPKPKKTTSTQTGKLRDKINSATEGYRIAREIQPKSNNHLKRFLKFASAWDVEFELKILPPYLGESQVQNVLNLIQYDNQVAQEYKIIFDLDIQSGSRVLEFGFLVNDVQEKKVFALPSINNDLWFSIRVSHKKAEAEV